MSKFTVVEPNAPASQNVPVKLSALLKPGEFNTIGVILDGKLVPSQINILARHPDGSIRHALVIFFMDTVGQVGTVHNVTLDPSQQSMAKGVAISKTFDLSTLALKVQVTDVQDYAWSKDIGGDLGIEILKAALLQENPGDMAFGPLSCEFEYITSLDGVSGPHPSMNLILRWRFFQGWPAVRLEVVIEASKESSLKDIFTKSIDIWSNGKLVFTLPNQVICTGTRFRHVTWIGAKPPIDDFCVKQDRVYIREMDAMPLYDLNNPLSQQEVDQVIGHFYRNKELDPVNYPDGIPLFHGILAPGQGTTGDRQDIDPQPEWTACSWNSDDLRGLQVQFAADGNSAGAFPVHIRDPFTNEMGLTYKYHITAPKDKWNNPCIPNRAHHALVGFVSYVMTGDKYYAEELAAWATFCTREWPWDGKIKYPGSRDDAWSSRTIAWGAYILPDNMGIKTYLSDIINLNLDDWMGWVMDDVKRPLHTWETAVWNGSGRGLWPCGQYISPWQYAWKVWSLYLIWRLFNDDRAKQLFDWSVQYHVRAYVSEVGKTFTSKDGQTITWEAKYADQYSFAAQKYTPMIDSKGKWAITPGSIVPIDNLAEALWYVHVNESNSWTGSAPYPPFPPAGPAPENWAPNPPSYRSKESTFEEYSMADLAPTLVLVGVQDADKIWSFIEPYVDARQIEKKPQPKGVKRIPFLS